MVYGVSFSWCYMDAALFEKKPSKTRDPHSFLFRSQVTAVKPP